MPKRDRNERNRCAFTPSAFAMTAMQLRVMLQGYEKHMAQFHAFNERYGAGRGAKAE